MTKWSYREKKWSKQSQKVEKIIKNAFFLQKVLEIKKKVVYLQCQKGTTRVTV